MLKIWRSFDSPTDWADFWWFVFLPKCPNHRSDWSAAWSMRAGYWMNFQYAYTLLGRGFVKGLRRTARIGRRVGERGWRSLLTDPPGMRMLLRIESVRQPLLALQMRCADPNSPSVPHLSHLRRTHFLERCNLVWNKVSHERAQPLPIFLEWCYKILNFFIIKGIINGQYWLAEVWVGREKKDEKRMSSDTIIPIHLRHRRCIVVSLQIVSQHPSIAWRVQ